MKKRNITKGKTLEVVETLKDYAIKQINNINLADKDFECSGVEEIRDIVSENLGLINGIYQDLLTEYLNKDSIIEVYRNENGYLEYKKEVK